MEITTPPNAPSRYHLSIKQTLRMYFTAAQGVVQPDACGDLVWETAQRLATKGVFEDLLTIDAPQADEPLAKTFEGIDSNQTRIVLLDPRRWTLLNGRDSTSRTDIRALFGLGEEGLRVDNAASAVVVCVNTQRRDKAVKRAREVLAWREVIQQLTDDTEDELQKATTEHDKARTALRKDIEQAYQHYAYLVRAGDLDVQFSRFANDSRTTLNGGHVWTELVEAARATQPGGLGAGYLAALLDGFDRELTLREIVQAFYKNPAFPLVPSADEIRRVIFTLANDDWELVDGDGERLAVTSAEQISIKSIHQSLRRRQTQPHEDHAHDPHAPTSDPAPAAGTTAGAGSSAARSTPGGAQGTMAEPAGSSQTSPAPPASGGAAPPVYKRYRLQLAAKSITGREARDQAWQLLQELRKVLDPSETADHQLLTLDLTLVTAEGQQGAIEAKAAALGARVTIEDDDF